MVKQFKINLNRQEGYAQRLERKRRMRERITLTVITLFVLVTMGLTYTADTRMREIVDNKEYQLERIVAVVGPRREQWNRKQFLRSTSPLRNRGFQIGGYRASCPLLGDRVRSVAVDLLGRLEKSLRVISIVYL